SIDEFELELTVEKRRFHPDHLMGKYVPFRHTSTSSLPNLYPLSISIQEIKFQLIILVRHLGLASSLPKKTQIKRIGWTIAGKLYLHGYKLISFSILQHSRRIRCALTIPAVQIDHTDAVSNHANAERSHCPPTLPFQAVDGTTRTLIPKRPGKRCKLDFYA